MMPRFECGEPWKKVYGPVFIYLNSTAARDDSLFLWDDAKIKVRGKQLRISFLSILIEKNRLVIVKG